MESRKDHVFAYARLALAALVLSFGPFAARGQVTPAEGSTPPDDTPSVKVGVTLFTDFTYQSEPESSDSAGSFNPSSFNVSRAYINVTGSLNHLFSYRITPDITRETFTAPEDSGVKLSTNGSYVVRLKYAFGQLNLDDWVVKGSWVRLGLQQTPYIDYMEGIYRYRFQGPIFVDRDGYLTSSDSGLSARFAFPGNYGDAHFGYYNGEGYSKVEANNEKAFQARVSVRPAPMTPILKGLRIAAFVDSDTPTKGGKRDRLVGAVTFEHPRIVAGFEYLEASDQASATSTDVKSSGWSAWVTPRLYKGFEVLLRYDDLKPDKSFDARKKRSIGGVAYWFNLPKGLAAAVLADYEQVRYDEFNLLPAGSQPNEKRYALHALFNY